jgi:hypothetical protein
VRADDGHAPATPSGRRTATGCSPSTPCWPACPPACSPLAGDGGAREGDPALDAFTSQARRLAASYEQEADRRAREALAARLESDQRQVVLFAAALTLSLLLLGWIALSLRRDLRSARRRLDDDERELVSARAALARATELERGQARVLERIATGAPLRSVFQCIVDLACELTGLTFALRWDSREVECRPGDSGDPAPEDRRVLWSAPIGIDREGAAEGCSWPSTTAGDRSTLRAAHRCCAAPAGRHRRDHDPGP